VQQAQNLKSRLFLNFRFDIQLVSDTLPPNRHQSTSAGERIRACSKLNKNEALVRHARVPMGKYLTGAATIQLCVDHGS
jgi:hypothetical protein